MQNDKVLSMLGIAAKSGNVVSGEFSTEKAVKTGHAYLVIVSEEASDNTRKSFMTCRVIVMEARKRWEDVSERNSVHHLQ